MNKEDIVVAFMNPKVAKGMELPDDVAVVTGLLSEDTIIVVKRDEFLDWLYEEHD